VNNPIISFVRLPQGGESKSGKPTRKGQKKCRTGTKTSSKSNVPPAFQKKGGGKRGSRREPEKLTDSTNPRSLASNRAYEPVSRNIDKRKKQRKRHSNRKKGFQSQHPGLAKSPPRSRHAVSPQITLAQKQKGGREPGPMTGIDAEHRSGTLTTAITRSKTYKNGKVAVTTKKGTFKRKPQNSQQTVTSATRRIEQKQYRKGALKKTQGKCCRKEETEKEIVNHV